MTVRVSGPRPAPEGFQHRQWEKRVLSALSTSRREGNPKARMGFLVTAVAMDWAGWADRDGVFFRSAQDTADAIGAAVSNVRDAIKMLIDAGLAEVLVGTKKQTSKRAKGRDATTYRLLMADNFHLHGGNNSDGISAPVGANNSEAFSAPVGAGFSAPTGAPIIERTLEGAGARVNAPPAPVSNTDVVLFEEDHDEVEKDVGARERAPVIPLVSDPQNEAAEEPREDGGDPFADALAELDALHGDEIGDVEGYLYDLIDGFHDGDRAASQRAARLAAKLLLGAGSGALGIWFTHRRIVHALSLDTGGTEGRADAAVADFHSAVAAAGEALKAERRAQLLEDEADDGEGYGF